MFTSVSKPTKEIKHWINQFNEYSLIRLVSFCEWLCHTGAKSKVLAGWWTDMILKAISDTWNSQNTEQWLLMIRQIEALLNRLVEDVWYRGQFRSLQSHTKHTQEINKLFTCFQFGALEAPWGFFCDSSNNLSTDSMRPPWDPGSR